MSVRFESPDLPASRPHDDLNTRGNYKQGGIVYNTFKAGIGAL